ncbi:MAG TPA: aconitase/3-isopropylmalate dehydratase large subunit family protein [Bacteroidales bacterium]|nr:aconitase/3-isopropylmalate dehydratase large subunit family protein [Bacteroidales bacterium]HPT04773.1 aconitase/3-isopropylmalate dehydratase large subunit family protein [Bacteroidales bacterium]
MTLIEKILAAHSNQEVVKPGDIIDVFIDTRAARDFGGANVVKNIIDNNLPVDDPSRTCFTFDCNPGGSDQKYAANQHYCRLFARQHGIKIFDVDSGIGTHIAIDSGLVWPGSTFVSTDSHANIMGAIGAFGQGMGDQDIAAAWANGKVWFKVPQSIKLNFTGKRPADVTAKDIVLNLLSRFGANKLLGRSVELYGEAIDDLTICERITISSMATEMGAIILLITPTQFILDKLKQRTAIDYTIVKADKDANYEKVFDIDISAFKPMVALPGHPHDDVEVEKVKGTKIDSAFIGSCTNGRMLDLRAAASVLRGRKVAPGVVLKIVPATNRIWNLALEEGLIKIFKDAGALVSNAGCAGCAAGQLGQNGPEEVTISTGNRNFAGKQGKGLVYLASPETVAASAVAGYITTLMDIPSKPAVFEKKETIATVKKEKAAKTTEKPTIVEGKAWFIKKDDIDTDMIFHNRYLTITDIREMGQYTFDNLEGYKDFAKQAHAGDIVVTTKNFGAGSSRQQAVDCFSSLGIQCIIAESFGAIYERNAINAALPIMTYQPEKIEEIALQEGDILRVNFITGEITNVTRNKTTFIDKFYDAQLAIYNKGGLLG